MNFSGRHILNKSIGYTSPKKICRNDQFISCSKIIH